MPWPSYGASGQYRVKSVGLTPAPVRSMGGINCPALQDRYLMSTPPMSLYSSCLVATAGRAHPSNRRSPPRCSSASMPDCTDCCDLRGDDSDYGCRPS